MTLFEATMPDPTALSTKAAAQRPSISARPESPRRRQGLDVGRIAGVTDPIACNRGDLP
jgi:hypothetical protein